MDLKTHQPSAEQITRPSANQIERKKAKEK